MSAAAFVLAINLFVAAMFATAFAVIAAYQRSSIGARWLALGYGLGVLNPVLEFILPFQEDARPVAFAIFSVFLFALTFLVLGLARHYSVEVPRRLLGVLVVASLLVNLLIVDMERDSFLRATLYQMPYALMMGFGINVILAFRHKRALDIALMGLFGLIALHFLAKPFLSQAIGSGEAPQAYLGSTYAAISQSVGAILLITNGLLVLLILVRDVMAEITARSETDTLSGLYNRRGFEDRADRALLLAMRSGVPAVMIVADLDHFKQINDGFGHGMGDQVIAAFAGVLREGMHERAILGRTGGEEFAIFLPGINIAAGRLYAETVRGNFAGLSQSVLGVPRSLSASFGVAAMQPGDGLSDLARRADLALYRAKTEGRDRVVVTNAPPPAHPADGGDTVQRSG